MSDLSPWDALDIDLEKPDTKENEKLRLDVKRKYQMCFGTEAGKWVLDHLNGLAFNRPVVDENAVNVLASAGIREGEIRKIRMINRMMQPEK